MCLLYNFPSKNTAILHSGISALEISRIRTSIGSMFAHVALRLQRKKHAVVIEHILPYKLLSLAGIGRESHIT